MVVEVGVVEVEVQVQVQVQVEAAGAVQRQRQQQRGTVREAGVKRVAAAGGVRVVRGWVKVKDPESGETYYYNILSGRSEWLLPGKREIGGGGV